MFNTQWLQHLHTRHILIGMLIIYSSTFRRCDGVCGHLHFRFRLMIRQQVSRVSTRKIDKLQTKKGDTAFKCMKSLILGFNIISIYTIIPHKKYTGIGLSPHHAQFFALFDTPRDNFYKCHFDNLYTRKAIAYTSFTHYPKILSYRKFYMLVGGGF